MGRKRRGNGEGSIYQRADGTWCATYNAGYDERGRRRRRTIFGKTRQSVQEKLRKLLHDTPNGNAIEPQRLTVGQYLDRWLAGTAKNTVKPTTYANYEGVIRNYLKPHLGGMQLTKLGVIHIQSLYASMDRAGKSAETIRLAHAVLRRALKQAVRWRLVPYNVCADVDRPRVAKADITPLDPEQVAALLAEARGDRLEALIVLAVATGMRLGELLGLHANTFKPLLKRASLPDIRFHDLRHTSATLLLSAGVHPKVVQERLGHSQIGVTLDIYSHVLPTLQRDAASKLDEMLAAGGV